MPENLVQVAVDILTDADRPLSVRRILNVATIDDAFGADPPSLEGLRAALECAEGVYQVRPGVFAVGEAPEVAEVPEETAKKRRRRRPSVRDLVGDEPASALSVEDAVADIEAARDPESLRHQLWERVRARATVVLGGGEPEIVESAPEAPEEPVSTVDALFELLRSQGKPVAGQNIELATAENTRRVVGGERAPFTVHEGQIGLTEWGMSARYLELEAEVLSALVEQRDEVCQDLLAQLDTLEADAFETLMLMLMEAIGQAEAQVVHRTGKSLALTAVRPDQADKSVIVIKRGRGEVGETTVQTLRSNLPHFGATEAILITMGPFSAEAISCAGIAEPTVTLIDGERLARLLYTSGLGLATHRPVVRYLDTLFFESLSR